MLSCRNVFTVEGNLGVDPVLRYMPGGTAVLDISIAESIYDTSDKTYKTQWHNVKFFDDTAKTIAKYMKKGSPIFVSGGVIIETWDDDTGKKQYKHVVHGSRFEFVMKNKTAPKGTANQNDHNFDSYGDKAPIGFGEESQG